MRCGCQCACVVQAGSDNVHVVGVGTPSAPYQVSVDAPDTPGRAPVVHVFHHVGALTGAASDEHPVMYTGTAYLAQAHLTVAGSTDTTVEVLLNGASAGTITIAAGDKDGSIALSLPVDHVALDLLQTQVTSVGTGASGLWVGVYV